MAQLQNSGLQLDGDESLLDKLRIQRHDQFTPLQPHMFKKVHCCLDSSLNLFLQFLVTKYRVRLKKLLKVKYKKKNKIKITGNRKVIKAWGGA